MGAARIYSFEEKIKEKQSLQAINGAKPEHPYGKRGKPGTRKTPFTADEIAQIAEKGTDWAEDAQIIISLNIELIVC